MFEEKRNPHIIRGQKISVFEQGTGDNSCSAALPLVGHGLGGKALILHGAHPTAPSRQDHAGARLTPDT